MHQTEWRMRHAHAQGGGVGGVRPGLIWFAFFFFQAEDGIRDDLVTGVQTCALPISTPMSSNIAGSKSVTNVLIFLETLSSKYSDTSCIDLANAPLFSPACVMRIIIPGNLLLYALNVSDNFFPEATVALASCTI